MYNQTILMGRLTEAPILQKKQLENKEKEVVWVRYRLAVNRDRQVRGQPDVDFFSCVAFGKKAEFIARYGQTGTLVLVCGRLETGVYLNKHHEKIPTLQLIIQRQDLCAKWKKHKEDGPERAFNHAQDYPEVPQMEADEDFLLPDLGLYP